jgi:methyl-accepting chemotaxis protein
MNSQPNPMHYDDSETSTDSDLRMAELQGVVAAIDKSQAMIEFSLDGRILHANANFCGAVGYSLDEIKGQHHSLFVEPAYRDSLEYKAFWAKLGRGEFDAAQYKRIGKGGKEIWIQASYNPVFDASGKPCKVVKFATDITAEKMRAADQQGQIDAIGKSQAVISFDLSGKILHANENFLNALGYALSEVQGQHHSIFVEPVYRSSHEYRAFWDKLARGEFDAGQYKRITKTGGEIWIQASYNPIFDPSGKPYKVVKFATDITAQVNANRLLEQTVEETVAVVAAASGGDLTQRIPEEGKSGSLLNLCTGVNDMISQLTDIIGQIKDSTDTITTAAGEIASGNADLSQRTEEQAASLEETASSMEELTSTVRQNAENARTANQLAIGAADVAGKGGDVVSQVVTTMSAITESSKKIVDIISVIDGIAFQTNILALNAAVEAARAGEQGRGFAVVASEVRSLAQRSAGAAKEIKSLIGDSVEKVQVGSTLVEQAGKTMSEIVTSVKRVTDIMAEISAASQEQSAGIEQVNTTITQMDEVTQQNAALVEEASAAARSLEEQAGSLTEVVSRFVLSADPVAAPPQPSRVQRPAPSRPSARPVAARSPAPANPRVVTPKARNGAANGSGDQNWQEF